MRAVAPAPTARRRRVDARLVAVLLLLGGVAALLPIADEPLGHNPSFLPVYVTAVLAASVLTAYLLTQQFLISGSRRALALSWAYVWAAVLAVLTAVATPGVVMTGGLLEGAGVEQLVWTLSHSGFAVLLAVAAAPWSARLTRAAAASSRRSAAALGLLGVVTATGAVTGVVSLAPDLVPGVFRDAAHGLPAAGIGGGAVALNLVALLVVAVGSSRDASVKPWVLVAAAATAADVVLAVAGGSVYTVGWYAGRVASFAAASVVLFGLMAELNRIARDLASSSQRLQEQATIDSLTRLLNRRTGLERGEAAVTRAAATGYGMAVALVDIDHFKRVNDEYGHAVGDDVLVTVARRMESALRDGDLLCRYGGEEFLVILPHASAAQSEAVADRLLEAVRQNPVMTGTGPLPVTVSVGLTMWVRGEQLSKTLARADDALYAAKDGGRNQCVVRRPDTAPAEVSDMAPLAVLPPLEVAPLSDAELDDPRVAYEAARFGGGAAATPAPAATPAAAPAAPVQRVPEPSPLDYRPAVAEVPEAPLPVPGLTAGV